MAEQGQLIAHLCKPRDGALGDLLAQLVPIRMFVVITIDFCSS